MVYMYNYLLKHNGKIHERQEQIKIVKQRLEELPEMMYEALTEPLSDEERFNSEVNRKMDEYRAKIAIDFICKNLIRIDEDLLKNSEVTVTDLKQVVIDGNTYYYFKNNKDIYRVSIKINSKVAFIKNNDIINVSYKETKDYNEIISINE